MQNQQTTIKFTDDQIEQFAGFAATLERIHQRLIIEGYTIKNGMIKPPKDGIIKQL